ncbi:MAG TPA: SPOR domain-containing protein, partial [Pyrinomonadaceae bacterium]|nr:SPOR domain-containing protein [Pyrinomonadaceae bacterium]
MRSSLARRVITFLLAQSFVVPTVFSQQETRPRRAEPSWPVPAATTPIISAPALVAAKGPEPTIRVALTTEARSAVISTTGHLMNASGNGTKLLPLDTARVRVDPRLLSPLQQNSDSGYRVIAGGAATREETEEFAKEIRKSANEDVQPAFDTETKSWGLVVGAARSREEAEELRARLEAAGIDATIDGPPVVANVARSQTENSSPVRLTSRPAMPAREVVASSSTGPMFSSGGPVAFAS